MTQKQRPLFKGWNDAKARTRLLVQQIVNDLEARDSLSDWEASFVSDMDSRLRDETWTPTENQLRKLQQISDERSL